MKLFITTLCAVLILLPNMTNAQSLNDIPPLGQKSECPLHEKNVRDGIDRLALDIFVRQMANLNEEENVYISQDSLDKRYRFQSKQAYRAAIEFYNIRKAIRQSE